MLLFLVLKKQCSGTLLLLQLFGLNNQIPLCHLSLLGHTQAGTQHWWATMTAEATPAAPELSLCKDGGCDPQSKGAAAFSSPTAKVLVKA